MNSIFQINRFANLEKQSFFLSKMQILYIVCVLASLYILSATSYYFINFSINSLIIFLLKLIIVISPCFLEKRVSKNNSVFDFILPASTFEKLLSMLVKYVIVIPVMCFATLGVLNLITGLIPADSLHAYANQTSLAEVMSWEQLYMLIAFQSIFILGNFYFRRHSFAKTCLVLLIASMVLSIIIVLWGAILAANANFRGIMDADSQLGANFSYSLNMQGSDLLSNKIAKVIMIIFFPFGLWVVSYFKLRETEI